MLPVATSIVFNRVSDTGLPDSGPQKDLKDCNVLELGNISCHTVLKCWLPPCRSLAKVMIHTTSAYKTLF